MDVDIYWEKKNRNCRTHPRLYLIKYFNENVERTSEVTLLEIRIFKCCSYVKIKKKKKSFRGI